jgi:fructokinase
VNGAIEAGGAKFICGAGTGPEDLQTVRIPTTTPGETVAAAVAWLRRFELRAVGIGSFGPVDLDPASASWGHITRTPKAGWRNYDLAGEVRRALGVRVAFNTDVNAAAVAESRWGAGRGVANFLYVTVGSGIGGGAFMNGRLLGGATHPEMGHIRIPHDWVRDPYAGACPFHGDCLEGLASGPAIEGRWRHAAADLPDDHPVWELEAHYLALGLANFACTLSPARILLGGGVMRRQHLYHKIRRNLPDILKEYVAAPDIGPPGLGERAGVLGALALAERALAEPSA